MSRLEQSQELTPQEQKRVIATVDRMWQQRNVPAWIIWTALYRFAATQIWQLKPKREDDD